VSSDAITYDLDLGGVAECARHFAELSDERRALREAGATPTALERNRRRLVAALQAWNESMLREHAARLAAA
jgi:hypothetical protein